MAFCFDITSKANHSIWTLSLLSLLLWNVCCPANGGLLPETLRSREESFSSAKKAYESQPSEISAAEHLAKAAFKLADVAPDNEHRAEAAQAGIAASREALRIAPTNAAAHYYLGLNLGQLAQTKKLGALSLIREMEKELLRSIELNPQLDHAGADRSLGMLYLETPGWPISIGNKRKAREHLQRAVALAAEYPDNLLTLMEAYVRWHDSDALRTEIDRYAELLPKAKKQLTGPEWAQAWQDWDDRWEAIQKQTSR